MIRLLMIDDHKIVRDGLKEILHHISDITVIDEAETGKEGLVRIRKGSYNVVLLDVGLPDANGITILTLIKQEKPHVNVLMLSMYPEEQFAIRALKTGAAGYLTKGCNAEELIRAIRKVMRGEKFITPSLAERMACYLDEQSESPKHEKLSDREYMVMQLIGQGSTISEIADKFHLSVKTISTYRTRIFEKMSFRHNADLIRYTLINKIVL